MRQTIIAMSGQKGSGKNELARFIRQYLYQNEEKYDLWAVGDTIFECSFADKIKQFCVEVLNLTEEQTNGTDQEKNSPTQYMWEDAADYYCRAFSINGMMPIGPMTGRQIMQLLGTEHIRNTFGNVWASSTIRRIKESQCPVGLITDNRFPDEAKMVLAEPYGYVIRLTRNPLGTDAHKSETALQEFKWERDKCFILDNEHITVEEQNEAVIPILDKIFLGEIDEHEDEGCHSDTSTVS